MDDGITSLVSNQERVRAFHLENALKNSHESSSRVHALLRLAQEDVALPGLLECSLDLVLSFSWLRRGAAAAVFLAEGDPDMLVLHAHRGLTPEMQSAYARIRSNDLGATLAQPTEPGAPAQDTPEGARSFCIRLISRSQSLGWIYVRNSYGTPSVADPVETEERCLKEFADALACVIAYKRDQEALRDSEKYRSLFEFANDSIFIMDPQTRRILDVNQDGCSRLGYTREELIQLRLDDIETPTSGRRRKRAALEVRERGHAVYEGELRRKDGSTLLVEVSSRLLTYGGREVIQSFARDVTDRKREHEEREQLLQQVRHVNQALTLASVRLEEQATQSKEALRQVSSILESITDAFVALDRERRFTYVNAEAERLLRRSRQDLMGKTVREAVPEALNRRQFNRYERVVSDRVNISFETYYAPSELWLEVHAYSSEDGVAVYFHDVTDRKRAEQALRESEERYRTLFETSPDAIVVTDLEARILMCNQQTAELLGYASADDLVGVSAFQHIAPEDRETSRAALAATRETGHGRGIERTLIRRDGARVPVEISASLTRDADGKPQALIVMLRDIAERKRAEESRRFISEANALLTSSLDYETVLASLTRLAVPYLADACVVNVLEGESIRHVAITCVDPSKEALLRRITERFPVTLNSADPVARVLRTGRSELHVDIPEPELRHTDGDPERLEMARQWNVRSGVVAPLVARGRSLGVISLGMMESGRRYGSDDLVLVEDLARRAALAIDNARLYREAQESFERMHRTLEGTIEAIAMTVEIRDPYTAGHQKRVAELAAAIAEELGIPAEEIRVVRLAATIHDIGKIGIPAEILTRPRRLTEIEYGLVKSHARVGHDVLKAIDFPWPIAQIVLQHHERMDGSGYPSGLIGRDLLLAARILSIADVVEAMASHRPYRPALGVAAALDEIAQHRGDLYDPEVVDACRKVFIEKAFTWKFGQTD